jgi:ribonucleoside-diphosphate reductase alpha chain
MQLKPFTNAVSYRIWHDKYRLVNTAGIAEPGIEPTWQRVAQALARAEGVGRRHWASCFDTLLRDFTFLPGGRILAGAGSGRRVTLFNCFVMGLLDDSIDGIFSALREGAITMHQGGGIGYDFSTLRPSGMRAGSTASIASGPLVFMRICACRRRCRGTSTTPYPRPSMYAKTAVSRLSRRSIVAPMPWGSRGVLPFGQTR